LKDGRPQGSQLYSPRRSPQTLPFSSLQEACSLQTRKGSSILETSRTFRRSLPESPIIAFSCAGRQRSYTTPPVCGKFSFTRKLLNPTGDKRLLFNLIPYQYCLNMTPNYRILPLRSIQVQVAAVKVDVASTKTKQVQGEKNGGSRQVPLQKQVRHLLCYLGIHNVNKRGVVSFNLSIPVKFD